VIAFVLVSAASAPERYDLEEHAYYRLSRHSTAPLMYTLSDRYQCRSVADMHPAFPL
jgi:hypothetical protein